MEVYIGLEGYLLPRGYIVKEVAILHTTEHYEHYIIKAPEDIFLTLKDVETVCMVTKKMNRLSYSDGFIPYNMLARIFDSIDF